MRPEPETAHPTTSHTWTPTMQIRWVVRFKQISLGMGSDEKILQQCFIDTATGETEWRDVEVVSV